MSTAAGEIDPRETELITLIGFRGCGKTEVGRKLAERLGWEFHDTDEKVTTGAGRSISEIFAADGEKAFRMMEAEALERALAGRRRVVSVGGGAVLARRNRKALRSLGGCIWLTASAEELHRRIAADEKTAAQRPPLTTLSGLEEVETLLQARLPVYEATADYVIGTMGLTVEQVVDEILTRLMLNTSAEKGS
jgi:shikimate kinase